jgi:2-polyprenyl-3-methyl-5-hydroxy-6-metoxy-1,4-benzoquinol methylase
MGRYPSIDQQKTHYDAWNLRHRQGSFSEIEGEIQGRGLRVLENLRALDLTDASILEVGCGTGWLTEKLCEFGPVTAIDLSPRAIAVARDRVPDANFVAGDFFAHEFPTSAYDVGVCIETLFYVVDQPRFMEKLASLLKPGGILALTTINKYVYERSSDVRPPAEGQVRQWLSRQDLQELVATHFEILSIVTIEPRGDQGLLRLTNSYKVNTFLGRVMSQKRLKRAKESLGLGGGIVIMARKRFS